jgi:perosamine synthetase
MDELKQAGIGCSVHWRPLHLHPYYQETYQWRPDNFPNATALWERSISLPLFPGMQVEQVDYVIQTIIDLCARYAR